MAEWGRGWRSVGIATIVLSGVVLSGCASSSSSVRTDAPSVAGPIEERMLVKTDEILETDLPKTSDAGNPAPEPSPSQAEALAVPEYRIAADDVLAFRSFDDESISSPQVAVRFDGCISLPLIEDVHVAGLTRAEALEVLRDSYRKVFKDPQISLTVVSASGQTFYVLGDVNSPSEYPYRRPLSVLQAINVAGGIRDRSRGTGESSYQLSQGSLSLAYIIRHQQGDREIIECDLKGLTNPGPHPSQILIHPDDIVFVPEGVNLVYIMGAVLRPTVLSLVEGETLLQVLARSGGLAEPVAYMRKVVVIRGVSAEESEVLLIDVKRALKTGKDFPLEGGDIIYVPRRPLVRLQDFSNRFAGSFLPLMNLYNQAYSTYYTDKQFRRLFDTAGDGTAGTLSILQGLRDFGSLFQTIPVTP